MPSVMPPPSSPPSHYEAPVLKDDARAQLSPKAEKDQSGTLGSSLIINGTVVSEDDLVIECQVSGTINARDSRITIGRNANITGQICAREVVISGNVLGDVEAEHHLKLTTFGQLSGNVIAPSFVIEDGAYFKGSVDMERPGRPVLAAESTIIVRSVAPFKIDLRGVRVEVIQPDFITDIEFEVVNSADATNAHAPLGKTI